MSRNHAPTRRFVLPLFMTVSILAASGYALVQNAGAGVTSPVHVVPTSIDRTGTKDVTAALNGFIKSVPDGGTIIFPASSRYRVENIILVGFRHNLVIDGNGALFFATTDGSSSVPSGPNSVEQHWPRHRDQWLIYDSSNVTLRNLSVRGANAKGGTSDAAYVPSLEAQAGVDFYESSASTLENCNIKYTYGDLVYIGNNDRDISVRNCTLSSSGRQGITVAWARNVLLDHNQIEQVRRTAIDLEPYGRAWGVFNVWIVNNTFRWVHLDVIGAKGVGDVSQVVIAHNHLVSQSLIIRNAPAAPIVPPRHDWYVIGNVSDTSFGGPQGVFFISYTTNVTINGNFQPLQKGRNQVAIQTPGSTNVHVGANTFPQM